jgi:hypothetical protein
MGRTNACRAQQKRERNLAKGKSKANSQLKSNEAACSIVCAVCRVCEQQSSISSYESWLIGRATHVV